MDRGAQPPTEAPPTPRRLAAWSLLWGVLAVLHVTQAIWVSGGRAWPGDLGDGRFNQLVLEHGYQALRGWADWVSPGQFHPVRGTLAYSDTHAGTLPLYAMLRRLSISREEAWQIWFVAVAALNAVAAFRLAKALAIDRWLRGPLVFASAGSALLVWMTAIHPQMLPVFPGLLAWEQAVRWTTDRSPWRLAGVAGWLGWQFAANPYLAFFVLACGGFAWIAHAVAGGARAPRAALALPLRQRVAQAAVLVIGGSLAGAALLVYGAGSGAGAHALSEVVDLAPTPASWFTSHPARLVYPAGWPAGGRDFAEHALFTGVLPWVLALGALAVGWRARDAKARWAFALAGGALLTVLFFTRWSAGLSGAWLWLATHAEPFRAFRASGRVAGLMQFLLIGGAGLLLTRWRGSARGRWAAAPLLVAVLVAAENVCTRQPATLTATARARTAAVIAAWKAAGDRPLLAFAPGYTNQPESWIHLDAWSAALQLRRATLNGYTGGMPSSHVPFGLLPTVANARAVMAATGVPAERVSLVEDLDGTAAKRIGFQRFTERPVPRLAGFDVQPAGWTLSAPLEQFTIDGHTLYQFTPPAEVRFRLPADATFVEIAVQMRPGSYDGSGRSDGIGLTWLVRRPDGSESLLQHEVIAPRERPEDRGLLRRGLALAPGSDRMLVLRVDAGPQGNGAWDWPLFGLLRVR